MVNSLVSFVVITGPFAAIYKILPEVRIEWEDVMLGSIVTSLLFTAGKLIGLFTWEKQPSSTYRTTASVVILIVWVYYSAQIFFF